MLGNGGHPKGGKKEDQEVPGDGKIRRAMRDRSLEEQALNREVSVSYTHLDVYKRQVYSTLL